MFFYLSKIIWFFLQPSSLLLFLLVAGMLLQRIGFEKLGKKISLISAVALFVVAFSPLAHILTVPLENRFVRPVLSDQKNTPDGIIVLGGVINSIVSGKRKMVTMTQASERLTEAVSLARRFPKAKIIFTGGSSALLYKTMNEADLALQFFLDMGIAKERIMLERRSRNTYENAVFSALSAQAKAGENWLLITSAFHMPRSMGCFRKAGFKVMAWPVDYRSRGWSDIYRFFAVPSQGLRRIDLISKEWIGLIVYRLTGKTSAFFPRQS